MFGSYAFLNVPITFDRRFVEDELAQARLGFAGDKTAIGDAIGLATKRLTESSAKQKVIILMTDGANTTGSLAPEKAAELAADAGIRIHTIGIGADTMVHKGLIFDRKVNPSRDLDEKLLTYISSQTGGKYYRARSPEDMSDIYKEIDKLEPVKQDNEIYRPVIELYFWPLGIAILLVIITVSSRLLTPLLSKKSSEVFQS
jgi:Ca-activated chloride channel family protein